MKCDCERCGGTGEITCDDCDGQGIYEGEIQDIKLERSIRNYSEILEYQKDALRVIRQAEELKKINPNRSKSYEEQLRGALFIINGQADRAAERK